MSDTYTVLHDHHGLVDAELPLDRAPYEALVTAVLAWQNPNLTPADYEQIALQLTGHARALAADVQHHAAALPKHDGRSAAVPPTISTPPDAGERTLRSLRDEQRVGEVSSGQAAWSDSWTPSSSSGACWCAAFSWARRVAQSGTVAQVR
ncbi:hypothetical protein [Streptomyces sp. C10-9-1]|uniref:hypothetical protein n=1 Tax=Streptomyces sp. C10-9-1 TaxID=1859285 RepID=UPI003F49C08C